MKYISALVTLIFVNSSFAFTTRTTYSCLNDDKIEVTSSLMPTGEPYTRAESVQFGALKSVICSKLDASWKMNGSETCFANEISVLSTFGKAGTLTFKDNGQRMFTICQVISEIQ